MLWPFRDLQPSDPSFTAVNMLAIQGCLPIAADEVEFHADEPPTPTWMQRVEELTRHQMKETDRHLALPLDASSRGEFARRWWRTVADGPWKAYERKTATDADGDGISDRDDPLPLAP
jgi:hypothetical protein